MCPSSPSAWQIWSWADPFPSLSKKLFYFVKKGLLQTAPKRDRRSRKGPPISFFCNIQPSMPPRWDGNGHSAPCRPVIDRPSPLRPLLRSASGAAGALCAKIIEACCAQDCRLSRRPEEVLNIMRNAPAKPLCKGPRAVFLPLHCRLRRSNVLCHKVHFSQGQVLCHSAMPAISEQKNGQTKAGCVPKDTPCQFICISQCALRPAQNALRARKRPGEGSYFLKVRTPLR